MNLLRKIFSCFVLGHSWIVATEKQGRYLHWDSLSMRCEYCHATANARDLMCKA